MGQITAIILIIVVWLISFVEPSGWAIAVHLQDKINYTILGISILLLLFNHSRHFAIRIWLIFGLLVTFIIIPYLTVGSWQGASYLVSFLVVYIISQCKITTMVVKYSAIPIAIMGLMVLFIYKRGSILSGWNDNAMSMIGLFSFAYFSIFLISVKKFRFLIWNIVTIFYLDMLFQTDCRSGILFSMLAVACIVFSKPVRGLLQKKYFIVFLLNLPLIVALLVISFSSTPEFDELNKWSLSEFQKPIFNGREILWDYSIKQLTATNYIGMGKFEINFHNSGIAALSVFGILGYICWIKYFSGILRFLNEHISDNIVYGSMLAFSIIYLQQSVDLGFISQIPNLIPYMILGIGLGRVRNAASE